MIRSMVDSLLVFGIEDCGTRVFEYGYESRLSCPLYLHWNLIPKRNDGH